MRPFRGGVVTHNGVTVYRETVLKPGDVIGMGDHFLFLYRDPRVTPAPPLALTLPWQVDGSMTCCPSGLVDRQEALRQYLGSTDAVLKFHSRHADSLLQVRRKEKILPSLSAVIVSLTNLYPSHFLGDNLQKFLSGLRRRTFSSRLSPIAHDRSRLQTPGSRPHAADTAEVGQFD